MTCLAGCDPLDGFNTKSLKYEDSNEHKSSTMIKVNFFK